MNEIISRLEALFLHFNLPRLLFWLFLLALAAVILILFESLTGFFYLSSMERKVSLLKELHSLAQSGITQNNELRPVYEEMARVVTAYKIISLPVPQVLSLAGFFEGFWKFLSGAFLGLVVAAAGLTERAKGNEKWQSTLFGGLFFGLIAGIVGMLLPTIYSPLVNYIGYPVLQVMAILLIPRALGKRKAR